MNVIRMILLSGALMALAECGYALDGNGKSCATGRDLFNAPITFDFPYLGAVGSCNLQTHSNGWTYANIDRWEFATCDNFSNGIATVVVNGQTNTWTILSPDKPLYKFGRYTCGFLREDRPDETHAIYAGLFFNGVMVGAEHLREHFNRETHTWQEVDDVPDGISKVGGGEWETGFIVWPNCCDNPIDINQMIIRHGQPYVPSLECLRWLKTATEKDIHDKWDRVQKIIDSIHEVPGESNADSACKMVAILRLKDMFLQMLLRWKILNAKSNGEKYAVLGAKSSMEAIQKKCDDARRGGRGSHAWPDWGEWIQQDLLKSWLLKGDDATYWNKVAFMKGVIDGHSLEFQSGFATVDLPETKDEHGYEEEPLILFKVQDDFYFSNGYVYAKVIGDRPGYCYMPCTYEPPTYVVRVDAAGNIVNWYRYPKQAKTLKEFLGPKQSHSSGDRAAMPGTPYRAEPRKTKLLCESSEFSLVAGETAADTAANQSNQDGYRNSLFLKRCRRDGTAEWRLLLTTGSDWREADGMSKWESDRAKDVKGCFAIRKASFSSDERHLWLVCDPPYICGYSVVCSYDVYDHTFRVLIDGDAADEQPDGTILVKNKKTYLDDDNGESLGARWYDAWIMPDGKVVRKGKLKTVEEVVEEVD